MKISKDLALVYGINPTEAVIRFRKASVKNLIVLDTKFNSRIKAIISEAESNQIKISYQGKNYFENQFESFNHQGIAILCEKRPEEEESFLEELLNKQDLLLLILDHLTDPHNVGACMRSAAAANADAVIVPKNRACHLNPTVRKVSSGGSELIPFIIVTNLARILEKIRSKGVEVVGADPTAKENYSGVNFSTKVAFVIGSEDKGLKRLTSQKCDKLIKIDMPGRMESLNTSVSAGILLFEYLRQIKNNIQ